MSAMRYICKGCGAESPAGIGYAANGQTVFPAPAKNCEGPHFPVRCTCARHTDGSVTTFLCSVHADTDPCLTMSLVTGRRRKGTVRRGICTACGHGVAHAPRVWVETLLVARRATFLDYNGAPTYGGLNLARVLMDDDGRIWQVSRTQVRAA